MGDVEDFTNFMNAVIDKNVFSDISGYIDYAKQSKEAEVIIGGNYDDSKGIYNEPRELVYKDPYIVNQNFIHCLDKLFAKGAYVGIATHVEKLIFESLRLIENIT